MNDEPELSGAVPDGSVLRVRVSPEMLAVFTPRRWELVAALRTRIERH